MPDYPQELQEMLDNAKVLYSKDVIEQALSQLAKDITSDYSDKYPIMLCVINGAIIPMAHLLVKLDFHLQVDTVHASRYHGEISGSSELTWHTKPKEDLKGRDIIIFDDILDQGLTLAGIIDFCEGEGANSVKTAVMVDKHIERDPKGLQLADYTGITLDKDVFVIGYGLDYKGYFRNLPEIMQVV
jgi:hypoxanthine phosphoribosyltransferase